MFGRKTTIRIDTERLVLRPPMPADMGAWISLRRKNAGFLKPWEPTWSQNHLSASGFSLRVSWSNRVIRDGSALPLFIFSRKSDSLIGGITLDPIRRGPAQSAHTGYWLGEEFSRRGYMTEALLATVYYAYRELDLSRVEAACLPDNIGSRALLEGSGFKYEGVAQSYLQIAGRWRTHVLYSNLRRDRRGKTDAR